MAVPGPVLLLPGRSGTRASDRKRSLHRACQGAGAANLPETRGWDEVPLTQKGDPGRRR